MIGRLGCLALVCLALGVSSETPQSPWPALTPTTQPVKQTFDNGHAIAQLALTLEEEVLVEMMPFKPPFKMDKKQMAVVLKLLKKLVKPVLKSERLRTMVAIVDEFMQDLEYNQENKKYYNGMLDAAQDVYKEVKRMYNAEPTDEAQARTWETVSGIYRSSILNNWFVQPFNEWILTPITSRITSAADRIYNMIPDNTWVVDTNYVNPFQRWSETWNYYVNRISNFSSRARHTLEATARLLEEQDAARCHGCGSHAVIETDTGSTEVQ